jgi:trigger factor
VEKAYNKQKSRISLPGFRKGKVPRKVLEKHYGDGVFYDEGINELLKAQIPEYVKTTEYDLVDTPSVAVIEKEVVGEDGSITTEKENDLTITPEKGVKLSIELTTKPQITLPEYKDLKAPRIIDAVPEDEVDKVLERTRQQNRAVVENPERPVQAGDVVTIDFKGYLDGKAFEGGEAKKHELEIGSNSFVPGFEDGIIGHSIGEKFFINVTFPEDYSMKELAGKQTSFKIKIHSIKEFQYEDIDDEFAQSHSEFDTLEEYKNDIRAKLQQSAERAADINYESELLEQLADRLTDEIPQAMFEQRIDSIMRDTDIRLRNQGISIRDYIAYQGMSIEEFRGQYKKRAEVDVKVRLILDEIVKAENITLPEGKLDEEYAKIAEREQVSVTELEVYLPKEQLKADLLRQQAAEWLRSISTVDNTIAEEREKAALAENIETMLTDIVDTAEVSQDDTTAETE